MNFHDANSPPLDPALLTQLESRMGAPLPKGYREFLLEHNGGQPENQLLYVPDCKDYVLLDVLLGLGRPHNDLNTWVKELEDDMGDSYLPIGFDPGGNAFLLKRESGEVLYWDSARHFPCSTDEDNAYWVADSFEDLLGKLESIK